MMVITTNETATGQGPGYWSRMDAAQAYSDFTDPGNPPISQRQYAQEHGVPRSTLGFWLRQDFPDLDPDFVHFFRCPSGQTFLRQLLCAALLVFHHDNAVGLHPIADFLQLLCLDPFVATSYGALYTLDQSLQNLLILFGKEQRQILAEHMLPKDIVLCPDEHFHGPHPCLVAIDPVSNFILVETYQPNRDSQTWAKVIKTGIEGLPVTIVGLTSDCASGLICCAQTQLQVGHQPDLFHLQRDLCQGLMFPLERPIQQAEKDLEKANRGRDMVDAAEERRPDSVPLEKIIEVVQTQIAAEEKLQQAKEKHQEAVEQIKQISAQYHPFDRESGQPVNAEQMQSRLSKPVEKLQKVVEEERLSQKAEQAVDKARKWVAVLVACLARFWLSTDKRLQELDLSEEAQRMLREYLMASYYWQTASKKESDPEERKRLAELARELWEKAWEKGGALAALAEEEKEEVKRVAGESVKLFSRSSSCVEGRNGRLSLYQHGQTRMSQQRLQALTVVHNYVGKRADGSTAAERFFGLSKAST